MARKSNSYEELYNKLEQIVNMLERNEMPIEEALKIYEEGVKTSTKLYKLLNDYEGKIKVINQNEEIDLRDENEE